MSTNNEHHTPTMPTHPAVVTVSPSAPLELHQVPTIAPVANEVLIHVEWTASTPLDMHQALGGLLVKHPQILGDGFGGTVTARGPAARYAVGDRVFGFTWRSNVEKAHQTYLTAPDFLMGLLPRRVVMKDAVTVPNNFVTAWHTLTRELGFKLPWPKPEGYEPPAEEMGAYILIWGGGSSVGQFLLQILKAYGYRHVITTASKAHHEKLERYGAEKCFDYHDADVVDSIKSYLATTSQCGENGKGELNYLIDSIGHLEGSVTPLSRLAPPGAIVPIMLPITLANCTATTPPNYSMDPASLDLTWAEGTRVSGVRTHFYLENEELKEKLQSEIMPKALEEGWVEPNEVQIVEGKQLLERAEKALALLREGVSGRRLVWRVAEAEDVEGREG
jgi:NADPH:quinone reductase-like Zn-dependent oxidoreductase